MHGEPDATGRPDGFQDARAVAARRVDHELARLPRTGGREPAHQTGKLVVRHGEQDQLAALHDALHVQHGNVREQGRGAFAAGLRRRVHTHHGVARAPQRRTEHGTDPARADDAHAETAGTVTGLGHAGTPHRGTTARTG